MSCPHQGLPLWSVWLLKRCGTCQWTILAIKPPCIYTTSDCWNPTLCPRRCTTAIQADIHCGQLFPGRTPLSVQDSWGRSVLTKQSIWHHKPDSFLRTGNNFSTTSSSVTSAKVFSQSASRSWEKLLFSTLLQQQWYQQLGSLLRNHVGLGAAYSCKCSVNYLHMKLGQKLYYFTS